jgi:predicted amidohydrolase
MTDQLAAADYPADPADLFVRLYDSIADDVFQGWTATRWYADERVRRQAAEIADTVLESGVLEPAATAKIVAERGDLGRFVLMLGLDTALAHANPYGPYFDTPALAGVLVTYLTEGKLNGPGTTGALLPRCAFPGRPLGLRTKAEFFGVQRIAQADWNKIDHRVLPAVNDPHFSRDEPVAVGCAPVLETFDDVEIEFEERHGTTVYRLRPMDSSGLRSRVKAIVRRLDESGAQLAVMPEASLSDSLLELWKEVAFDTAGRDRDRRPLRFLLLGTGPLGGEDPPPNRAVLLDRWTGQELLVQDKLSGFTLDAAQMRLWRLPDAPSSGTAVEYARPGTRVSVLDSSLGRLAVLICEDLGRSIGWERELLACGVSHLLVPIFSKPILEHRWEEQGAERQVATLGTWVTVSNSLAVGAAIPDDDKDVRGSRYTCLVAGPESLNRTAYATERQFGVARTGAELGRLPTSELPRVFPGAAYDVWHEHWADVG